MVDIATVPYVDTQDATKAPLVHTHTPSQVGLGNVDNTSDANKPVSTAQAAALTSFGRDRGSASTLPSTDLRAGDNFRHTVYGFFIYSGAAWRQEFPLELTASQRVALSTASADIYVGFRVFETDTRRTWSWGGSTPGWEYVGGGTEPTQLLTLNSANFQHYGTVNAGNGFKYEKVNIQRKVGGSVRITGLLQVTASLNAATWYQLVTAPNLPSYAIPGDRILTYASINGSSSLIRVDVIPNNSNFTDTVPATISAYSPTTVAANSLVSLDLEYQPANVF